MVRRLRKSRKLPIGVKRAADSSACAISRCNGYAKKGTIDSEVMQILNRAIGLDNRNPVALTLSGIGHQQRGETATAISQWNTAIANLPLNSELSTRINELIRDAKEQLNSNIESSPEKIVANIKVKIEPQLVEQIGSDSTMFVFLKSNEKSPPLYAIKKKLQKFSCSIEFTKRILC